MGLGEAVGSHSRFMGGGGVGAFREALPALGRESETGAVLHLVLLLSSSFSRLLSPLLAVPCTPGPCRWPWGPQAPPQPRPGPTRAGRASSCCGASCPCPRCARCSQRWTPPARAHVRLPAPAGQPWWRPASRRHEPRLLVTLMWLGRAVSPVGCALQLLLVLSRVTPECFLLPPWPGTATWPSAGPCTMAPS